MNILHTSDWHLGQSFMGKSRKEEHQAFLQWLLETINTQKIDLLIVAGDIFDTGTPPNYALELYYDFLTALSHTPCKNTIIIAGNHDSIATLQAPKVLLKTLNVFVITSSEESEEDLIQIHDSNNQLVAIVCGVAFLRDQVIRKAVSGQTMDEKEFSLSEGIKNHYNTLFEHAKKIQNRQEVPIIATGHLTTVGAKSSESEREIYIGGSLDIDSHFLGEKFDYVALGHLHINQKVSYDHVRYSGSPIALSFSEANQKKKVNIITFEKQNATIQEIEIPKFRALIVLKGDFISIEKELKKIEDKNSWIEIHLNDENPFSANQKIRELAHVLELNLLAVKIDKTLKPLYTKDDEILGLDALTPLDLFNRRLELEDLEDEEFKQALIKNFKIIVDEVEIS